MFADINYLTPCLLFSQPPTPMVPARSQELYQQPAEASDCASARCQPRYQPRLPRLTPSTVRALGASPSAVHLHTPSLTPITGLHCFTMRSHPGGNYVVTADNVNSQGPAAACGPRSGPVFCSWPASPCTPVASLSSRAPACARPNPHH